MVPRAVISPDDRDLAMPAGPAFCARFGPFGPFGKSLLRLPLNGGMLAYFTGGRCRVEFQDLINHFDRVAVLHQVRRAEDPVRLHIGNVATNRYKR